MARWYLVLFSIFFIFPVSIENLFHRCATGIPDSHKYCLALKQYRPVHALIFSREESARIDLSWGFHQLQTSCNKATQFIRRVKSVKNCDAVVIAAKWAQILMFISPPSIPGIIPPPCVPRSICAKRKRQAGNKHELWSTSRRFSLPIYAKWNRAQLRVSKDHRGRNGQRLR